MPGPRLHRPTGTPLTLVSLVRRAAALAVGLALLVPIGTAVGVESSAPHVVHTTVSQDAADH